MRTTLTLDDDVEKELRHEARRTGRQFKDVVNEALRRGLASGSKPVRRPRRFRVRPRKCGFRPGIDLTRLNQLVDEIEVERRTR
jgi:plasmid stability protein